MRKKKPIEFEQWLPKASSHLTWNWKHQIHLYGILKRLTDGELKRLMIFMPPRHSKSETVTVHYSAYRIESEPTLNIILGSYNQKLANRFSRRIKRLVEERKLKLSNDRRSAEEWETLQGGGVRAVGVGAGVTGFGAKLIVIDDPVKNRAQAESETFRQNTWDWFNDDIYTRLEPEAAVILIQTRWHEDDLAGRLLKEAENGGEQWEIVSLPAIAEDFFNAETQRRGEVEGSNSSDKRKEKSLRLGVSALKNPADPLGREPGEALCPERYDEAALAKIKRKLGSYSFSALYQQRPVPSEGGLFKREWFKQIVDRAPGGLRWVRAYDLAVSTKTSADYTASFRCAIDGSSGILYIADGFRGRIEFPDQRRYVKERITEERDTRHCIESALHGQAFVQELQREVRFANRSIRAVRVDVDKQTRALAWQARAEAGKVVLVRGPWIDEFLDEVSRFPHGKHDDQVDAISLAVQMIGKSAGNGAAGF